MCKKLQSKFQVEMKEEKRSYVLFKEELKKENNKTGYICKRYGDVNQCGCLIEGKIPSTFVLPYPKIKNGKEMFKIAMLPSCGNEFYDIMKRCALASFFNDKKPKDVKIDNVNKKILVLLDGCASCKSGGMITGLRITHLEKSGGLLSKCSEIKEFEDYEITNLKIRIPEDSSFTLPFILYHRVCEHYFFNYKLSSLLNKNCNNIKGTKIINLPSIDVSAYKERVTELCGIRIKLDGHMYILHSLYCTWTVLTQTIYGLSPYTFLKLSALGNKNFFGLKTTTRSQQ
ncbi:hypothetical protein Mgra_00007029 [Meloidogyne graminicola]|uniref:Uncharacterized protein n=1 Tax=Meloidogyne graminicola TaxID=189291 RepID=A0A8S9ZJK7_9BILA|nr:hypothetical protein Mgra_00007029 [Meloidogyne graminicola]